MTLVKILKKKSVLVVLGLAVIGIGYGMYHAFKPVPPPRYVTASVGKGTIITTVTGSGQVSSSNQIDVKPRASGTVLRVPVVQGQTVKADAILTQLDTQDAYKTLRDAELNLESAKLSLQKLVQPPDALSVTQAKNALDQAKEAKQTATDDLTKAYSDGYNSVVNTFLDMPNIMSGLHDLLLGNDFSPSQSNIDYYADAVRSYDDKVTIYHDTAYNDYETARTAYDQNFNDYKTLTQFSDQATVEKMISETYDTSRSIDAAIKSATNLIQFYEDRTIEHAQKPNPLADAHLASLNGYTSKADSHVADLLSAERTIQTDQQNITDADRTITEKTQSLSQLNAGADPLDIQSAELTVNQREAAVSDAETTLADYTIRAPIDGIVAQVDVKPGDQASSGSALATLVATQQMAEISFNEVDVAKIKVGQKATMTFDAIDGLEITGEVAQIDTLGTVSQGVVSYNVKIIFDMQDDRVKPGMSVSAAIITNIKQDVLTVPNSAVKTQGNTHYVEMFNTPLAGSEDTQGAPSVTPPTRHAVQIGLADDTNTEITSGLNENDQVVVRTITSSGAAPTATPSAPSLFPGGGGSGFRGGGGARIGG